MLQHCLRLTFATFSIWKWNNERIGSSFHTPSLFLTKEQKTMIHTYCMISDCALALIHQRNSTFMDKHGAADAQASLH